MKFVYNSIKEIIIAVISGIIVTIFARWLNGKK
ncbi:type I toxin-antitoxin system Fst family toxin [Lactococcus lactis]